MNRGVSLTVVRKSTYRGNLDDSMSSEWAHQDLNLGPTDYESAALTTEL